MRIGFAGFSLMDGKGEENNEIVFLKRMVDELSSQSVEVTYFHDETLRGINDINVFNYMGLDAADRFNIEQYTNFPYLEFEKYSEEEISYGYKGHIPQNLSVKEQNDILIKNKNKIIKGLENLRYYFNIKPVDIFIVFGNYLISNIIKIFCRKNNIRYYVLENGYFRPFTLMIDKYGVNFESSIPKNLEFYKGIEVDNYKLSNYLDKPEYAIEDREYSTNLRKKFYKYFNIDINHNPKQISKNKTENQELNEDTDGFSDFEYIYIPFQLETDSQITKHSPYIKTMKDLVILTSEALEKYNRKNKTDLKIIYKCHPLFESELGRLALDSIEEICASSNNLMLLKQGDNKKLIQNAKLVITINSTVGFESLLNYKSVITLGEAFYAINGISSVWTPENDLAEIIEKAIQTGPNIEIIKKFIYYLRFHYFFEIYWKNPDEHSISKLVKKIIEENSESFSSFQLNLK
jgi:capsular polysaccharide export protein